MIANKSLLPLLPAIPAMVFILGTVVFHAITINQLSGLAALFSILSMGLLCLTWLAPQCLPWILFALGLTLPLYGFQSYTLYSLVVQLLVGVCTCLIWVSAPSQEDGGRSPIAWLLLLFCVLAGVSMLLLPLSEIGDRIRLWGAVDFMHAVHIARPDSPLYALAGFTRLLLFTLFALSLGNRADSASLCRHLGSGVALSILLACLAGVADEVGLISLDFYRPEFKDASGVLRLHSLFGNPGWFAQFVVIGLPFFLLLLPSRFPRILRLLLLSLFCSLAGVCLVLTASRTSWLILPIMMFACYWFVWMDGRGKPAPLGQSLRTGLRVATVLTAVLLVLGGIFATFFKAGNGGEEGMSRSRYLLERGMLHRISNQEERFKLWRETLALASEDPVFGLGYETYKWHQQIQKDIPASEFARKRRTVQNWDTPHNFFLQLLVGNGLVGIILWCVLTLVLVRAFWRGGREGKIYLIILVAFHLYGLTQEVSYVPVIFLLFFILAAYGIGQSAGSISRKGSAVLILLGGVLVMAAGWHYAGNPQSRAMATKYGLAFYGREEEGFRGFYPPEDWGAQGVYRWSGKQAEVALAGGGTVQVDFVCNAPRLESHPLTVDVSGRAGLVDRFTFWTPGTMRRSIAIDETGGEEKLTISVSRTWTPTKEKSGKDDRILGVAVGVPVYADALTAGLSPWQATPLPGFAPDAVQVPLRYRWTTASSRLDLGPYQGMGATLYLGSTMPYLSTDPVAVKISGRGKTDLPEIRLASQAANAVYLSPAALEQQRYWMVSASRLWNPKRQGYGADGRDIGVALAIVPGDGGR